jgi:hypothetical protein
MLKNDPSLEDVMYSVGVAGIESTTSSAEQPIRSGRNRAVTVLR